jgi:hypothetical protein
MNYEIEDNLNFYTLLNSSNKDLENDILNNNLCLISYEKITDNSITLDCKHSFNYFPLYQEIYNQKRNFNKYFDINKLKINEFKCPYCRNINDKLIPYIPYKNVKKISGVNYPENLCIKNKHTCSWVFKSGKNKGCICNANSYIFEGNNYCYTHHNKINKAKEKKLYNSIEDTWDIKYDNYIKKYKVDELKKILRENKLLISGNKKELIIRIINNNITL